MTPHTSAKAVSGGAPSGPQPRTPPDAAFSDDELLARPDAAATLDRVGANVLPGPYRDFVVTLVALAALRGRAATERAQREREERR